MADLTGERKNLQIEETRFRGAVSESLLQKTGKSINFINNYQYDSKRFPINGPYSIMSSYPVLGVDGLVPVEYNIEIINIWAYNLTAGASGTTELDIKKATTPGGAFTSIFSTTPKFTSTAVSNAWIKVGGSLAGATAPVLSSTSLSAGDMLRCDLVSAMPGAENCGLIIHFRPR